MKSISWKILRATLFGLVVSIVLLTAVAIFFVTSISKSDSEAMISQVCDEEMLRFNNEFLLLENSVQTISSYVGDLEEECDSEDDLLSDEFCDKVRDMTISIANRTDGAMAVYFRYNPELTGNGTGGFFWSRSNDDEKFSYVEPTDILQYDRSDKEHVGWFYEPEEKQEALWISPYYNKNLDVFMISYVIPYYTKSGQFLGVIGMDIDFTKIMQITENASRYKTGVAELIDPSSCQIYVTAQDSSVEQKELSAELYDQIAAIDESGEILYIVNDEDAACVAGVGDLRNGMKLMYYIRKSEVNSQRNRMIGLFAIIMAVIICATVLYSVRFTNKIVNPLKILTRITGQYAKGDWSDTYLSTTGDEIQELSESISVMAETTRSYIAKINSNANTDALTGLKNKNCYLKFIERYKNPCSEKKEYAVLVFDINYLKKTNDLYGHALGDELIKKAGMYICKVFAHSPVFRIGGDEYNVVMENEDFRNRDELCRVFEDGLKNIPPIAGDIPLSISYGMAVFGADGEDYDAVFHCADARMYEYKKLMKVGRI